MPDREHYRLAAMAMHESGARVHAAINHLMADDHAGWLREALDREARRLYDLEVALRALAD
jgi:hypothetical protein